MKNEPKKLNYNMTKVFEALMGELLAEKFHFISLTVHVLGATHISKIRIRDRRKISVFFSLKSLKGPTNFWFTLFDL